MLGWVSRRRGGAPALGGAVPSGGGIVKGRRARSGARPYSRDEVAPLLASGWGQSLRRRGEAAPRSEPLTIPAPLGWDRLCGMGTSDRGPRVG